MINSGLKKLKDNLKPKSGNNSKGKGNVQVQPKTSSNMSSQEHLLADQDKSGD
ncbi:hypothetical protein EV182_001819 [Spiromyces aspiralis]|uniref:Uncharacterized protein n=1 Tax=Spiromyces aspiralis TaxID=68401 RepID=A0ACC1HSW7_9FUNG|nr:hypothetical protein EV182_001819 [Spiromyces aspiralis]